jgi:hypothetical protein
LVSRRAYSGERCSLYCIIKGEANNIKSCAFRQHQTSVSKWSRIVFLLVRTRRRSCSSPPACTAVRFLTFSIGVEFCRRHGITVAFQEAAGG